MPWYIASIFEPEFFRSKRKKDWLLNPSATSLIFPFDSSFVGRKIKPTMTWHKPATRLDVALLAQDIYWVPAWWLAMGASQTLRRGTINQTLCSVGLGVSYKKRCNIQRPANKRGSTSHKKSTLTNRRVLLSLIWMKGTWCRICPVGTAIRKREHLVTELRIGRLKSGWMSWPLRHPWYSPAL